MPDPSTPQSNDAVTRKLTAGADGLWQPPPVEEAARLFPGYEVLALLGRGGMGAVYQARQIELDRLVAIKLLPLEISAGADFADRFRREARAMAKLNHPNIISVYDFGTTSAGHLFFVMEFVEGANLHAIIRAQELSADQALWLAGQVCTALAYAHGRGVVHRDIKPANVMVDTEGNAKVADFGLARLIDSSAENLGHTQTGTVMGTPDYMAPEQMRGMNVDHRADIYSVGVMLYEMLCREVPRGIFSPPSVRTGCDSRIDSIVVKAMQSEPDRRYQSTQEMKADVETARVPLAMQGGTRAPRALPKSDAGSARPSSETRPERAFHRRLLPIAAAVLVVGAVTFVMVKVGARGPSAGTSKKAQAANQSVATAPMTAGKAPVPARVLPVEPSAIKLWDTPEMVPKAKGVAWQDGAVRLHEASLAGEPVSRDAILRASVRADSMGPVFALRTSGEHAGYVRLSLDGPTRKVVVRNTTSGPGLGGWTLPRDYAPDEWIPVELRVVGDEIRVTVDGKVLGTLHDSSATGAGKPMIYGGINCFFRDIVYVPLDKAAGAAPAASVATTATKDAPFVNTLGMKFVPVPGTPVLFSIWDTRVQDYEKYAAAKPGVDGSWKTQNKDGVPIGREAEHPVAGVSWEDAQAFCAWLTEKETAEGKLAKGAKYRLPTDAEWSTAVGLPPEPGATPEEKHLKNRVDLPWGKNYPPTTPTGNYADEAFHAKFPGPDPKESVPIKDGWLKGYDDGYATSSPVGSFPANAHGLYDMGGNVWQWCEDPWKVAGPQRLLRGASWGTYDLGSLYSSNRHQAAPTHRMPHYGFRCVLEPAPSPAAATPAAN